MPKTEYRGERIVGYAPTLPVMLDGCSDRLRPIFMQKAGEILG